MVFSKALRQPGIIAIIALVIIVALVYFMVRNNVYMGGAPHEATDKAMDQLVEACVKEYGDDCSDFRIDRAQEKVPLQNDLAQGTDAAWCVELQMQVRGTMGWETRHVIVNVVRTNGELVVARYGIGNRAANAPYEQYWQACLTEQTP